MAVTTPNRKIESERLKSLQLLDILDTDAEQEFDDLVRLAAQICKVPISAISLMDAERQWFKSKIGVDVSGTSREDAFCAHAILEDDLFIVPNAPEDARFADNPLVTGEPRIRFYAGMPLVTNDGDALGSLCVIDRVPRRLRPEQKEALRALSRQVMKLFSLRRQAKELSAANAELERAANERQNVEKILRLQNQAIATISEGVLISEILPTGEDVIIYVNDSFTEMTGYTLDEIRGLNCRFLQGAETNRETIAVMREAVKARKFCAVEILNYRKDGTPFWNALSISPVKDEQGTVTHFMGVQQDITARQQAEAKLRISEQHHRFLFESVPQQIWTALPNGRMNYGNYRTIEYFGDTMQKDLFGEKWIGVVHPDDLSRTLKRWKHAVKTGEPYENEYRLRRRDGVYRWHLVQANPMLDDKGKIIKWLGANTDIHDRKTAEKTARETAEYRNLFQNANDAILIFELETEIVIDVNERACEMYGLERSTFIGRSIKEMSQDIERGETHLQQLCGDGSHQSFETVQFRSDGMPIDLLINSSMIEYRGRQVVLSINRDITEQKKMQEELLESQRRYQQLFDSNPHPIWVYDLETLEFLAVNAQAMKRYGYSREEFSKLTLKDLRPAEDLPILLERVAEVQSSEIPVTSASRHCKKDGTIIDVEVASQPITFGGRSARLVLATDITERKLAEKALLHSALHDELTGLPNRTLFLEHLRHAIGRDENRGQKAFAVLFLDFDHFKVINDSLGHMEGDNLLRLVAGRVTNCLRPDDIVARLGGDEFTILLNDLGKSENVLKVVERIQAALKSPFNLGGSEVFTTVSIGIARSEGNYTKPEDMLRDADIAMYRAKANGKAQHQMFDQAMHEQANYRLQFETEFRYAMQRNEFCLYYQPIINFRTDKIKGFESLVRWQHPTRGIVSPLEFIPLAEETGLIVPLGLWILRQSCRQLRKWQLENSTNPPLTMSVNLSCKQFMQEDLVEKIVEIIEETEIAPDTLRLEITESFLVGDSEKAISVMHRLRAAGIKLSIDDFGTGYSSLSYLHHLPVNYLKIDRSFVSQMQINAENREIVRTIILLAKNLNLEVIAEGVETVEQVDYLKSLDCDFGQGYLYSKPIDAQESARLLTESFENNQPRAKAENSYELINEANH